jgi:hypothetical protein
MARPGRISKAEQPDHPVSLSDSNAASQSDEVSVHTGQQGSHGRFMIAGAVTAGVIATAIMLGMCGSRLQFA